VVILDRRLAEREWGTRDPVGDHFWVRGMEGDTLQARVIGVVEHVPQWDHRDTQPTMYFPRVFYQSHEVSVVARVAGDPSRVGPALMSAIRSVDPGFPSDMMPMTGFVSERLAASRFFLTLMEVFAGVALLLSAVGLYGVLSYAVRQRTRELGIRLAFGAAASSLTADVVWSGARLALTGIAVGLLGAIAIGRGLEAQLFRVEATDPWALAATVGAVLLVSLAASLIPAVRAARVDPMVALRED
jgi:ABC-type antimicrobial peptide transport system permease subunit